MTQPITTFEQWKQHFSSHHTGALIVHFAKMQFPCMFTEIVALRHRFIDIAFHEGLTPFPERVLSATWARSVESVITISFLDNGPVYDSFVDARNIGLKGALVFGYGTVGFDSMHPEQDQDADRNIEQYGNTFLAEIAFGPGCHELVPSGA